jgi:nucleoside-diphosphate-sugar epimerase
MKKVLITGANGYLGSVIVEHLTERNFKCIKMVRNPQDDSSYKYELNCAIDDESVFSGADVLIHLAHDFSANKSMTTSHKINVEGSIGLFKIAVKHRVRIIFVSSVSSFEGCKSNYGKAKLLIEEWLQHNSEDSYIVRPGLVYGAKVGGITNALYKLTQLPIVPIVNIKNNSYIVNYADILVLIDSILSNQQLHSVKKPIVAASSQSYSLKQLLKLMNAKLLIPIPWQIIWFALKGIEAVGASPRMGSDSLISLINQNANPDFSNTKTCGITFSEFDTTLITKWN